ncbi:MAG: twin-arginine translocation signal domain-containing protein, partial [Verrucomicrobiota bacterium]
MSDSFLNSRRSFLERVGLGCGSLALTSLLHQQGVVAADKPQNPLASASPGFSPKAKAVIWLFQTGSPSQVDTFD